MDKRPLVEGRIANFVIFLDVSEFLWFCDFFQFSKKIDFGVFLVHPPMASVLLSASVERCFVSRMQDFLKIIMTKHDFYNKRGNKFVTLDFWPNFFS